MLNLSIMFQPNTCMCTHTSGHLLEELGEVVDVGGLVELSLVPLLVQLVLGHVGGDHLQTVQWACPRGPKGLKHHLSNGKKGGVGWGGEGRGGEGRGKHVQVSPL